MRRKNRIDRGKAARIAGGEGGFKSVFGSEGDLGELEKTPRLMMGWKEELEDGAAITYLEVVTSCSCLLVRSTK